MMDRIFIADKELVSRSFSEIFATDWVEKKFKDSLVVYSLKENPSNFDELKKSINLYRQAWENTLYKDVETALEEYSNILETFNYIGNVINTSGTIGFTGSVISPSPLFSGLSTFCTIISYFSYISSLYSFYGIVCLYTKQLKAFLFYDKIIP